MTQANTSASRYLGLSSDLEIAVHFLFWTAQLCKLGQTCSGYLELPSNRKHHAVLTIGNRPAWLCRAYLLQYEQYEYVNTAKALVVASLAFRNRPEPMIYHLHDIVTSSHFSRANRWVLVQLANCYAAKVIANSQATADAFVAAGGKRRLVTVIPNGFDPAPFDRAIVERDARNGAHASESGRKVIAVFGRLAPWKGQDVAIRATAQLPDVKLWIVGDALFGEDAYAEELHELVRELGVEERVHFLGFRDDVLELMQQADVVVHTSTAPEPFGRVVVEAMLSARPVVASRGGGAMEIIEEGVTGLLSTMGDADDLARCLQTLIDDPVLAGQLAIEGARVARERYSIDKCVAETNAVIEEVANKRRRPSNRTAAQGEIFKG